MSSAFCDGPIRGSGRSAEASGAPTRRARERYEAREYGERRAQGGGDHIYGLRPRLRAGELRLALLDEGAHALQEVLRARQRVL